MKVLIAGSEPYYNLEAFGAQALVKLGHQATFFQDHLKGTRELTRLLITRSRVSRQFLGPILKNVGLRLLQAFHAFDPDLVLTFKGEFIPSWAWQELASEATSRLVMWYPDSPRRFFSTLVAPAAPYFDHVFTPCTDLDLFHLAGANKVHTLPLACSASLHVPSKDQNREDLPPYTISFAGTWYPNRARALKKLRDLHPHVWGKFWRLATGVERHPPVYGPDYVSIFHRSKISLNLHHPRNRPESDGINMRVFEVTGSGGFLLTDNAASLDSYFVPGKEVVAFRNLEEMRRMALYYLLADDERRAIAERGCRRAHQDHTYEKRMRKMLAVL